MGTAGLERKEECKQNHVRRVSVGREETPRGAAVFSPDSEHGGPAPSWDPCASCRGDRDSESPRPHGRLSPGGRRAPAQVVLPCSERCVGDRAEGRDEAGRRAGVPQDALEASAVVTVRHPGEQAGPGHFRPEGLRGQRSRRRDEQRAGGRPERVSPVAPGATPRRGAFCGQGAPGEGEG